MASLFKRPRSPYWWVKYRDPISGRIKRESTGFRIGIGTEFGKARERRACLSLKEAQASNVNSCDRWDAWVPAYLLLRYAHAKRTAERIQTSWRFLSLYLEKHEIVGPQHLTREHCHNYLPWRRQKCRERGFNGVGQNTALQDLKLLSVILGEAMRRGIVSHNPCRDLGIRKVTPEPRPEMTDDEIAKIRVEITKRSSADYPYASEFDWGHFLRVSFEIALHQGCRLSETHLNVHRDVDLENMTIRFHAKGDRYYETALNPGLVPLFKELRASGRQTTFDPPKQRSMMSLVWQKFLARIGLGHLTFHCTRVTAVSRLERAGAPEAVVMQLVNHASTTVHRIYRRVASRELKNFWPSDLGGQPVSGVSPRSSGDSHGPSTKP